MKKIITFMMLMALFLAIGCATTPPPTRELIAAADYGPFPSNYEELIKGFFSPRLIDPYSAMYTFTQPVKAWTTMGGESAYGWVVCGTVNSKNRLGGYVGAKPFYIMINNGTIVRLLHEGMTVPDSFALGFLSGNPYAIEDTCRKVYGK